MNDDSSNNQRLADVFQRIASLLELTGADRFRVIAHDRAARLFESYPDDVLALAESGGVKALTAIEGVGAKIADKVIEFASTGVVSEERELLAQVPEGLLEVLKVPGLGPKTVRALWQTLGVTGVASLQKVIEDGTILTVPRMGQKKVDNIKAALAFAAQEQQRTPLGVAMPAAERIVAFMLKVPGVSRAAFAGSMRRGRDTVGDLDILVATTDVPAAREAFTRMDGVTQVLAAGESKCSVRLGLEGAVIQADLRMVPEESFGAAWLYFTGSKEHNVRLRERAQRQGRTLNEYGLYPEDNEKSGPHTRGVQPLAGRTEEEIFAALGVPFVPPELREDRDIDVAPPGTDELVDAASIRAELHAHTTASDGSLSIVELAELAKARGFHTIAVTDHSQSSVIAGGLKPEALRRHIEAVREAAAQVKGITILAGSEVDILADGRLDYEDELLALLDVVVASPHASLKQEDAKATERLLRAVRHPLVHVLGHPTGRIVGQREGFRPNIQEIAAAAAEHRVALEINSHWKRLDLRDTHIAAALKAGVGAGAEGCLIAIDCDVHRAGDFDHLRYGVMTARRAALTRERCVNTWTAARLHAWLRSKR